MDQESPIASLDLGPMVTELVALPWSGDRLTIARPLDTDRFLDRAAADPEQHLPYWAEL